MAVKQKCICQDAPIYHIIYAVSEDIGKFLMNMTDKVRYLTEILKHLVSNVNVTVVDPEGHAHNVRPCNLQEKVDLLAEHPELKVIAEVYYDASVHHSEHMIRPNNYKHFVEGQGKQIAKELKMELGCKMLGIS
ncbi:hypothetical protein AG74_71 [Vibrio phage AG74]|uniref:Uncharacterized protein n=1 Tax=Vibrio phage AG74 TaxID=2736261 RepID=A0A6M9Z2B2_9CAUD|nr:hypothetical protein KNV06_gp071 [Vibrio phage AG74]QKN84930.1 hypothetical protein AG74_71 [Vibrio phage AG74]